MNNFEKRLDILEKNTKIIVPENADDIRKEILSILSGESPGELNPQCDLQTNELRINLLQRLS